MKFSDMADIMTAVRLGTQNYGYSKYEYDRLEAQLKYTQEKAHELVEQIEQEKKEKEQREFACLTAKVADLEAELSAAHQRIASVEQDLAAARSELLQLKKPLLCRLAFALTVRYYGLPPATVNFLLRLPRY